MILVFARTEAEYQEWCGQQDPPIRPWGRHAMRVREDMDLLGREPEDTTLVFHNCQPTLEAVLLLAARGFAIPKVDTSPPSA